MLMKVENTLYYLTEFINNSNTSLSLVHIFSSELWLVVDEAGSTDGVAHSSCLDGLGALDEELKVAVNARVVQIEAVLDLVNIGLY